MDKLKLKHKRYERKRLSVKNKIKRYDSDRMRLCINRSNKSIYVQIIDDAQNTTLLGVSTLSNDFTGDKSRSNIDAAKKLGKIVADKAKEKGVTKVYFDRNGFLYHGKIKAFADAARENGLEF